MSTPAFTFTADGVVVEVFAEEVAGGVKFTFKTTADPGIRIDLNGFFLDIGGDGGSMRHIGSRANNMNGGNNDGYDYGAVLGSVGGKDADWMNGSVTISGITLDDLVGADAGLRATSYGPDGEGSLKLVADYTPPVEPPPEDHFPLWESPAISHVTLYFSDTDPYDTNGDVGPKGRNDPDGVTTVKFDVADGTDKSFTNDLDDWLDDALAFLATTMPDLDLSTLLGVSIKGGQQEVWYELDNNPVDDDSASAPPQWIVENRELDAAYFVTHNGTDYVFSA